MVIKAVGSPKKLFAETMKLALLGQREAQYEVGLMYANGVGTAKSVEKAVEWVSKAANRGLPSAQYLLGTRYEMGVALPKDARAAIWWFMSAAQQGHLKSQYKLGQMLSHAHPEASLAAIHQAAEDGLAEAQYDLAQLLTGKAGMGPDFEQAIDWYQRAAAQGSAPAQCALGEIYEHGERVKQNTQEALTWYRKAARQNYPKAQLALEYLSAKGLGRGNGNKKSSAAERRYTRERWLKAAEMGDADCKYHVGVMYDLGMGVEADLNIAESLYASAARMGHPKAQMAYADLLANSNLNAASEMMEQAAKAGEVEAQHKLAQILSCKAEGAGLIRSVQWELQSAIAGHVSAQKALAETFLKNEHTLSHCMYLAAAEAGDAEAQYAVGCNYAEGKGIAKEPLKAVLWWERAALAGHVGAASSLGVALLEGSAGSPNRNSATRWLLLAADGGDPKAQWNLGGLYAKGVENSGPDLKRAFALCHSAAAQRFVPAQATLGVLYEKINKFDKAIHWLKLAADSDDPEAQYNLALMFASGKGAQKNHETAFEWFYRAAEQGLVRAQSRLGFAYGAAEGVAHDPIEAHKWLWIAQSRGDGIAKTNLALSLSGISLTQVKEAERRAHNWLKHHEKIS